MDKIERAKRDVVIANRILAMEGVVDAYGHVSVRHPDDPNRYFLSRSLAPELVTLDDVIEYTLHGAAVSDTRPPYLERFIHGAIYEARPEIKAVVHAHSEPILPFGLIDVPLRPVIGAASYIGTTIPKWDIADKFGDETNLLVTNMDHGRDLAKTLGDNAVCLMRSHGFASAGESITRTVTTAVYLPKNARVQLEVMRTGLPYETLSAGEVATRNNFDPDSPAMRRGWEYWATKAGVGDLL
jgi:HCOMODA/2-hydroxy-3-carboxy-muconic semialdehyde decarboxylase